MQFGMYPPVWGVQKGAKKDVINIWIAPMPPCSFSVFYFYTEILLELNFSIVLVLHVFPFNVYNKFHLKF